MVTENIVFYSWNNISSRLFLG